MTNPPLPAPVQRWKREVDTIMGRDYLIDLEDAGAGDEDVARYFAAGASPKEFVDWFGEKYGLERLADIWPRWR